MASDTPGPWQDSDGSAGDCDNLRKAYSNSANVAMEEAKPRLG